MSEVVGQVPQKREPIAVIGLGCRFPGGVDGPDSYWDLLTDGRDALVDIPRDRWKMEKFYDPDLGPGSCRVQRGGFLTEPIDEFDAAFFGISPREADYIDPQQRLLLEVCWESLEDAGVTLEQVAGTATGVFIGGFTLDYSQLQFAGGERARSNVSAHTATGVVLTMLSNRISHAFDFVGPSMTVDTACSSSLVAVHLACTSLWSGESTMALAGGVNLMLTPNFTIAASQGGFLSPTSRSRGFDAEADGYVRGEGAGVVVLKRLADARRDGDRVYAVVRATAVTQDGHTNGITVPNGASQKRAMRAALADSGVSPSSISYVEAHGTGTPVGDPIEANAIGEVYGADRSPEDRCLVGSVKTNIGHLEAAAGSAAFIKAVLCLVNRQVPPHLNLTTLNPLIDLEGLGLAIPVRCEALTERDGVVRVGVNAFGFGGTNAHAVLETAPRPSSDPSSGSSGKTKPLVSVFPLAARSASALASLAGRYLDALDGGRDPVALASAVSHRRTHHRQARLAVVTDVADELREALASARDGRPHPTMHLSGGPATESRLGFVFTGMGPQWWGMGRQMLTGNRAFRDAVERCDAALRPLAGWSLVDELRADEATSRMAQTGLSQPANFALQVALVDVWCSLGINPDAVVGHSSGEIAAAYVAGALGFEDAVTVIYHRSRLQQLTSGQGRLIAVAIPEEQALDMPGVRDGRLTLAAVNGPASVALVGRVPDLEEVKATFDAAGVFCRFVDGNVPYHSPAMDPIEAELRRCLEGLSPRPPTTPLYSTVTGSAVTGPDLDADYWWRNVREPVRLSDAVLAMIDEGITTFVDVGPNNALGRSVSDCLRLRGGRGVVVASMRRKEPDGSVMANSCAELYVSGRRLEWDAFHSCRPRAGAGSLPAYPWQRQRYWTEADETRRDRLGELDHSLLGNRRDVPVPTWRRYLDGSRPTYLADHRVMGANLFPGAGYVEMALAAGRAVFGATRCVVEDVRFEAPVVLQSRAPYFLDTTLDGRTGAVEIHGRQPNATAWTRHASVRLAPAAPSATLVDLESARLRCVEEWDHDRCYEAFRADGFDYGSCFQSIDRLWLGDREAVGRFAPEALACNAAEDLVVDPVVLDGCFQMLLPFVGAQAGPSAELLPVGADRIVVHGRPVGELWAHATKTESSGAELAGDVVLTDAQGRAVLEVRGFRVRVVGAGYHGTPRLGTRWLHEVVWEPRGAEVDPGDAVEAGTWLVLADRSGIADAVVHRLADAGHSTVVAYANDGFRAVGPGEFEVRPDQREDIELLIRAVADRANGMVRGVVHLWSGDATEVDLDSGALSWAVHDGPLSILHLVQTLDSVGLAWPLTIVTVGGQPVDGTIEASGLLQAPLWGLGRVLHQESLSLGTRIMDLDPARPLEDVPDLVNELLHPGINEEQVAWRRQERRVARLQPSRQDLGSLPVTFRPGVSYLITGGLGALGLVFGRWMAARGARRIVLLGRSPLPPRKDWIDLPADDPHRAQIDAIGEIEALGAAVEMVSLDVADGAVFKAFLEKRHSQGLAPVGGVIHAAGTVHDQVLVRMDQSQMEAVLRPKILGAWSLHDALAGEALDFFVLFSSVASVVTTAGQGNYAAGNAFLDALAYYRRGHGLPALALNWGPWDTGMISQLGLQSLYSQRGIDLIAEGIGLEIFEEMLGSPEVQQVVISADWPTLVASYPIVPRMIEHLGHENDDVAGVAAAGTMSLAERLAAASEAEYPAVISDACAEIIGGVLRVRPEVMSRDEPLNQLGLDSMIAVEVRIRLEQTLGVAPKVVFLLHGATVTEVANFVRSELQAQQIAESALITAEDLAALLGELDIETAEALLGAVERTAAEEAPA